ncbi:putative D-mandelate dehydrogenase [Colletotrichum phormii]|uniref:D-mandelate dehydrogenase n=1 Tax=Colletotrichum phormii TaxID=359342 RepID=A0AAI9ZIS8_9PEZI|nr:putative D-mandelate dehydrogenase [Colletotrichum phormii]KAK1625369.1 putative D-mandelate dehydrogenase [Colletotrichum phormii]
MPSAVKPIVLHIGDPVQYNTERYKELEQIATILRLTTEERQRETFLEALREQRWGNFSAILRPFWNSGGEMGRWNKELISLLPCSVKVFASAGAGYDWANVDILAEKASSEAVADMALYHIISVFRNMQWTNTAARSGNADQFLDAHRHNSETAHNPRGHTLGIIGLGNIGYRIAQKAHAAFDMKIAYVDPIPKSAEQETKIKAVRYPDLDTMLAVADSPGGAEGGKALIDASRLAKMKAGSRLVNVGRGNLVDEDALADALESGHLFAAGLDVHSNEPRINTRLVSMRDVSLTCHTAGGAVETRIGFEDLAIRNVIEVLLGKGPLTAVNKHLLG